MKKREPKEGGWQMDDGKRFRDLFLCGVNEKDTAPGKEYSLEKIQDFIENIEDTEDSQGNEFIRNTIQ